MCKEKKKDRKQNKTKKAQTNQTEKTKVTVSKPYLHPLVRGGIVYDSKVQSYSVYPPADEHTEEMQPHTQWTTS